MVIYNYIFVGLLLILAVVFAVLPILVERLIAPRKRTLAKGDAYECGVKTYGETWVRFRIQYYIYAIMFVVFDIETVFLFPWAAAYGGLGPFRAGRDGRLPADPGRRAGLRLGQGGLAVGLIGPIATWDGEAVVLRARWGTAMLALGRARMGDLDSLDLCGSLVGFFGVFPGIVAYMVWLERKVAARFQDRIGPNRVGPLGLLQPIADALKLITKEDLVPRDADQVGPPRRPGAGHRLGVPGDRRHPVRRQHGAGESPLGHGLPDRGLEHQSAGHLPGGMVKPEQVLALGRDAIGRSARLLRSSPGALHRPDCALGGQPEPGHDLRQAGRVRLVHLLASGSARVRDPARSPASPRSTARRSTSRKPSRRSSPAITPSTPACGLACSSWPST